MSGSIVGGMESSRDLEHFLAQTSQFDTAACDPETFRDLSRRALSVYEQHPEQGEAVAQLMTGIWFRSSKAWPRHGAEWKIGGLFADLDVPPAHVEGGEARALEKWATIRRLVDQ